MKSKAFARIGKTAFTAVGAVAVLAAFASMHTSAAPPKGSGDASTLQVYTRETVVDVIATDSAGNPIRGLTQPDFTILEDGKPQPIRHFEEIGAHWNAPARELPENTYTSQQLPAPSPAVNILLLDLENEAPVDSTNLRQLSRSNAMQNRVKKAAMQAMENMPEGTRIAVIAMTYDLRIVQSFTSDRKLLTAAINAIPYDLNGRGNMGGIQANSRNYSVLEAFDRIATDSAAIHGRKNLIWFTVGIPQITDSAQRSSSGLPDYSLGLSHAYDMLTAAQVSVYPVDVHGVGYLGGAQLSEEMVAKATGGVAYSNTNDIATSVGKALDNGANYYSIAYAPPSVKYDGAYHQIEVKVDQPGVNLTFRKGYYADDLTKLKMPPGLSLSTTPPPAPKGDMKAPMSRGMAASSDVLFDVHVEPSTVAPKPDDTSILGTLDPKWHNKRLTRYGFQYTVPNDQIAFKNGKKGMHDAEISFNIAVYDSNDKLITGLSQDAKSTLTDASYQQKSTHNEPIKLLQQIDLPPGQFFIRVGVLDKTSNKTGTLELPLKVEKPQS